MILIVPVVKNINYVFRSPYLIGSSDFENFALSLQNVGQTAYGACLLITVLEANILRPPPGCTLNKDSNKFLCKPDQPVRNGADWVSFKAEKKIINYYLNMLCCTLCRVPS